MRERIVCTFNSGRHDNLDRRSNDSLLSQTNLTDNQEVLFEEKDDDGNLSDFPADDDSFMPSLGPDITFSSDSVAPQVPQENEVTRRGKLDKAGVAGHVGLRNLGNTCFANSALQCLSHSPNFVSHFLSNKYENELNADNPIGNQGELAQEYGTERYSNTILLRVFAFQNPTFLFLFPVRCAIQGSFSSSCMTSRQEV
jgi:ubiquitin carboxyl-terminal hydrolase 4/11/15